jgi:hypothetical protein
MSSRYTESEAPVDPASFRLALVDDDRRVYIGRQGDDRLFLVFRDEHGGGAAAFFRRVLTEHGVVIMGSSNGDRRVVSGIVEDPVTSVRIGNVDAARANNAFCAQLPPYHARTLVLTTPSGERRIDSFVLRRLP